jgi:hypothetical protein
MDKRNFKLEKSEKIPVYEIYNKEDKVGFFFDEDIAKKCQSYLNEGNESISAFAFKTGRLIEDVVKNANHNLQEENNILHAKIFQFRQKLRDLQYADPCDLWEEFDEHFDIKSTKLGEL